MDLTRLLFGVMYRVGFTPWEGHPTPARLTALVEGAAALPKGAALDIGCGTGGPAVYLAQHGWEVTGVDFVQKALVRARARADAAGASIRFVHGDVTRLRSLGIGGPFGLLLDNGCFHGLTDEARDAYVQEVSAVAAPGARLILMAFPTGRRGPGPRGVDAPEIERRFAQGWRVLARGTERVASSDDRRWADIRLHELERNG
jgi:SAM-dependent methyltransferase